MQTRTCELSRWAEQVGSGALCDPGDAITLPLPEVVPEDRVGAALEIAARLGATIPTPGSGCTAQLWDLLARLAAYDLSIARTLEPHVDALAILDQAGLSPADVGADRHSTWGVYAAEGPAGRLEARETSTGWVVDGVKPWCSLAGRLSHALVTAWTSATTRGLFAVPLSGADVQTNSTEWASRGLTQIPSAPTKFVDVAAVPVGAEGWYLTRPGFWWGAIGVAACWYGGAAGVARRAAPRPGGRAPDQIAELHLGALDTRLYAAREALRSAAVAVDDPGVRSDDELLARRVRALVREVTDDVLTRTARATGPAPLTFEEGHARRVADLSVYVRQEHGERDLAALGRLWSGDGDRR